MKNIFKTFKTIIKGKNDKLRNNSPEYLEGKIVEIKESITKIKADKRDAKTSFLLAEKKEKKAKDVRESYKEELRRLKPIIENADIKDEVKEEPIKRVNTILPKLKLIEKEILDLTTQVEILKQLSEKHTSIEETLRENLEKLQHDKTIIESKRAFANTINRLSKNGDIDLEEISGITEHVEEEYTRATVSLDMMTDVKPKTFKKSNEEILSELEDVLK